MGLDETRRLAWLDMQRRNQERKAAQIKEPELPLASFDDGGDGPDMTVSMKDYVDARDAAVRSDIHSEFANLRADIARLPSTWTLIGTALAIVSILIAVLAFGGTRFSAGLSLADQRQEQLARDQRQDEAAQRTNRKLDEILKRLPAR